VLVDLAAAGGAHGEVTLSRFRTTFGKEWEGVADPLLRAGDDARPATFPRERPAEFDDRDGNWGVGTEDVTRFGLAVLLVSVAVLVALLGNRLSRVLRVPAPALFLIVAALASDLWPALGHLGPGLNSRIVTVALAVILLDGGMSLGWRRLRPALGPVLWLGVLGTVLTAAGLAVVAHWLFGFAWQPALLLGTALAPTDPAVVFSVLAGREIAGRSGTILEGESGANDPVGIALLISVLGATGGGASAVGNGVAEFALQMAVGLAVGVAGGLGLRGAARHLPLPSEQLYPLRVLAGATAVYGLATVAHGSGFLAVLVAGIVLGDAEAPFQTEVERFASATASLGEIVAFTVLGLSIPLGRLLTSTDALIGLAVAGLMMLVVRPVLVGALLLPTRLRAAERLFVMWAGLKGAVPILLGVFILAAALPDGERLYRIIFVVVLVSVILQGGSVPLAARLLRIPMQESEQPHPYAGGLRFRDTPRGLFRYTVMAGSPADGARVAELDLGDRSWLSLARRDGALLPLRRDTALSAGDEVLVQGESATEFDALFAAPGGD
jgi:cell volume regulation protein A